jgi:hypothetical protein
MVSTFKLRVSILKAYLRCVDEQEARAGLEEIDGTTWSR